MEKILFINNQLGGGGAERVLTLIANHLANNKEYSVSILSLHKTKEKYDIDNKVRVNEIDSGDNGTLKIIRTIRKNIVEVKPDIVISFEYHMNMKVILATIGMKKLKIIISERNDPAKKGGKFPLKQLRNLLYRKADCLVCQTPDAKKYFPYGIQKKSVIIPNPIKNDLPYAIRENTKKEIVNFCRLEPQKNLKLLIDSFYEFSREYDDYILSIYGDGSLRNELESYIIQLGIQNKVNLYHAIPNIHEKIKDVMMFVSSSDFEGLSNSMIEAMAIGLPVICTDCPCGGARMVIENCVNGLLVPVKDKEKMVEAMKKIASDENFAKMLADESIKIRDLLATDKIISTWEKVIG